MPRRRRAWLALVPVAGLALALGFGLLGRGSGSEPPHPRRWDASVLPLVRFVEEARGLRFRHPVTVRFLSEADFGRALVDDPGPADPEQAQAGRDDEAAARALGLPSGPDGLAAAEAALEGSGTMAFYDDETERIDVRGTDLDVERRATLVHELTHALQDQHFDISREGTYDSGDRNAAFEAVVEGDAVRIEEAYVESLPKADRDAYDRIQAAGDPAYAAAVARAPDWLTATTDVPYVVGEAFTEALEAAGGRRAVDRALRTPPTTLAETMDADRYLRGDRKRDVAGPSAPAGVRVVDRDDLGALKWLLLLAERIPAADALRAVDGWGGDAYLAYDDGGRICVKSRFLGVSPAAGDAMAAALGRWVRAMPAGSGAAVSRRGSTVELASCDPGGAALDGPAGPLGAPSPVEEAMKLLVDRAQAYADGKGTVRPPG